MPQIKFYGSQVGGKVVTPHSYTGSPAELLRSDIWSALKAATMLPYIVWPLRPTGSGEFCELYPSWANLYNIFLHVVLVFMQLPFILSVPFWVIVPLPLSWIVAGVTVFFMVNHGICYLLNGPQMRYESDPKYTQLAKAHKHEQWIFLNGVAVGRHWMESNVNRLALTFGRPVLGVHNKTNGILFDVIQCLIQRNFNYATQDIRDCYAAVKETLYKSELTKVVFILHSQGGIEGGMIIDWLLQEVPQDLLAKLEVYTFGNAANHFNNPHLHLLSERAALASPLRVSTTKTTTHVQYHNPIATIGNEGKNPFNVTRSSRQSTPSGKTIRYIEHYAHTSDFVARWGVLYFTANLSIEPTAPRYMGRVFERAGQGHQFNQHYLDNMFPLKPSAKKGGGIGGSDFDGASDDCEFMSSVVTWASSKRKEEDEGKDEREGLETSFHSAKGEPLDRGEEGVLLRDMSKYPMNPVRCLRS
ncbi:hypothetical protein B0O99DRAFT_525448 [Bisporella sp. PMI_857]|nr:hypothetical protein B0O99DRAFT_525448 [Bisporella sp. PMI_857]